MKSQLTTHVLDIAHGRPAAGMKVRVFFQNTLLVEAATQTDGRLAAPVAEGNQFRAGPYRIDFYVGDYFLSVGHPDARRFLDVVPVAFVVEDPAAGVHVPLVVCPWSYSTYRGS